VSTTTSPVTYKTYEAAYRRVRAILNQYGAWPGIHGVPDGWRLSFDPDAPVDDGKEETP
jgi:uncharacterized protein YbdZ (MbtH family)